VKGFNTNNDETSIREELTEAFSKFGDVVEVRLPVDYETQRVKGFGYVVFADADGAPVRSLAARRKRGTRPPRKGNL
jgi:hypothetical protein